MNEQLIAMMMQMVQNQQQMQAANQQMINNLFAMMTQPQPDPVQEVEVAPAENLQQIADLKSQIADLQKQIADLQQQNIVLLEQNETLQAQVEATNRELEQQKEVNRQLAEDISIVESYTGESFDEQLEEAKRHDGDDYYDEMRAQWAEEGLSGKEKHDKIADFIDVRNDIMEQKEAERKAEAKEKRQATKAKMEELKINNPEEYNRIQKEKADKKLQNQLKKAQKVAEEEELRKTNPEEYAKQQAAKQAKAAKAAETRKINQQREAYRAAKSMFEDFV